jgi:hypothetical protein
VETLVMTTPSLSTFQFGLGSLFILVALVAAIVRLELLVPAASICFLGWVFVVHHWATRKVLGRLFRDR